MTYEECIIVSAYTGYLMCNFDDLHAFIQEKLKKPVWTHELAEEKTWEEIREAVKPDFMGLCKPQRGEKVLRLTKVDEEQRREARNRYMREWRKANPDKVKAINQRFWERKAEKYGDGDEI